jgi:succinate dehydrogenase / fumarate reductase, iron-sulfur subunit
MLGKLHPDAQKNLIESLPTALRGIASGKVTIPKVLRHHKLPDQQNVKDIYEKVHARPERIELNLYIVGEDADELEADGKSEVTPIAATAPAEEGAS